MREIISFLKWAEGNGWDVQRNNSATELPINISQRYPGIPNKYKEFLKLVGGCISPDQKSWFICLKDFQGMGTSAYSWDEVEKMSLDAAQYDPNWKKEITDFWDSHLPIYFSARDGYSYLALNVGNDFGSIVYGCEPEFEETEKIASSLQEFLDLVTLNKIKV